MIEKRDKNSMTLKIEAQVRDPDLDRTAWLEFTPELAPWVTLARVLKVRRRH